ncbi:pyridoxamine 5'-phosphate oxidase [Parendozoicomonas sp. Alg238-R29]|uniref:pyridoxamine 5'-phosphate oxidase n=1 Tax=Parendozoicomonas sp. Alg238-R29 TaxID=2993446 RepID=UPI00248EB9EE|nr:pyridoxamine 5'-phosphate oxidase [Parendozoicomonas sp. Alg238-R29]
MDLSALREEYTRDGLNSDSLAPTPTLQFTKWFEQAQTMQIAEPNAMSLATVSADGQPSLRTVLLKYYDDKGFVFFTNYTSNKAQHIESNPNVALMFLWLGLERQIVIRGQAEKIGKAETMKYFLSRPHGSQLGAWVSHQSSVITGRKILELKMDEMKRKFQQGEVPVPSFWGGYRVKPEQIEFWQGRPSRLHDRFCYQKADNNDWNIERLAP